MNGFLFGAAVTALIVSALARSGSRIRRLQRRAQDREDLARWEDDGGALRGRAGAPSPTVHRVLEPAPPRMPNALG